MAELDVHAQRRSSSQASSSSRRSQRAKTIRSKPTKRNSASSNATTTDLTSFPSLSPDSSPEGFRGEPALNRSLSNALVSENGGDGAYDVHRGRKATLARLTTSLPEVSGRTALFDDSVTVPDVPGALHLADDAHIERLIARTGAVKLVRQFARDLALRDAEISKLRQRADARERELKRMLREVSVSHQDIERRLYALENPVEGQKRKSDNDDKSRDASAGLDGLMSQAMLDGVGDYSGANGHADGDVQATIKAQRNDADARSGTSSIDSVNNRGSVRGWQDYIFGSTTASRKTSRASSVMSDVGEAEEDRPRIPSRSSARRKVLDEELFQPPGVRAGTISAANGGKISAGINNGDAASINSRKSSRSLTSWTVKLFAGNSQANKDGNNTDTVRTKNTPGQDKTKPASSTFSAGSKGATSAIASLKRINSNTGIQNKGNSSGGTVRVNPSAGRRQPAGSISQGTNPEDSAKHATNLGPVEMDAILPLESRPPTLNYTYNNYQAGDLLTDRFGFIYDQRRKKRQREAAVARKSSNRVSMTETISSFRSDRSEGNDDDYDDSQTPLELEGDQLSQAMAEDPEENLSAKRWQDYLRIATKPTELLSHTPSAGPIISLTMPGETKQRSPSVAVDKGGAVAVNSSSQPSATTSTVVADSPEFAGRSGNDAPAVAARVTVNEPEPVKLLLEQLTELHDSLQRERMAKWNEFLRKVRAERRREGEAAAAAAGASDRDTMSLHMPEATLADGELVGISGLGHKGKVGRAKWREFRSLVLGGVPVALRAKVWSECSGASAMRIPGYYEELVKGVGCGDSDPSVVAQIEMDIHRTLTDNVFFRKGPGVAKLKEVLLAYSRRNPEHYYDHGLLASRADQQVLRQYIAEVLPRLSGHLDDLGVEIEALTFQWFLSVFTDCLSAEALYRVWDVVLCLNVTSTVNGATPGNGRDGTSTGSKTPSTAEEEAVAGSGGGSTFLFQVALALLKLNEQQLLTTCSTPAALYTYINHQMTNHAISIDGLIQASEALRNVVRREDVVARRAIALREMQGTNHRDERQDGKSTAATK
ncbi:TBC domain protein [Paecilomyces variotii No. 5]|uniref:TBC domain protein n=1 Tax=Byssochlamys spectabilis (strain No. 5 / NBRC 109023) TaxID=1356009 RepID=V5FIU3_BYSSN|nr:TBC domain protein [Paecilomyces variotii No. 5]